MSLEKFRSSSDKLNAPEETRLLQKSAQPGRMRRFASGCWNAAAWVVSPVGKMVKPVVNFLKRPIPKAAITSGIDAANVTAMATIVAEGFAFTLGWPIQVSILTGWFLVRTVSGSRKNQKQQALEAEKLEQTTTLNTAIQTLREKESALFRNFSDHLKSSMQALHAPAQDQGPTSEDASGSRNRRAFTMRGVQNGIFDTAHPLGAHFVSLEQQVDAAIALLKTRDITKLEEHYTNRQAWITEMILNIVSGLVHGAGIATVGINIFPTLLHHFLSHTITVVSGAAIYGTHNGVHDAHQARTITRTEKEFESRIQMVQGYLNSVRENLLFLVSIFDKWPEVDVSLSKGNARNIIDKIDDLLPKETTCAASETTTHLQTKHSAKTYAASVLDTTLRSGKLFALGAFWPDFISRYFADQMINATSLLEDFGSGCAVFFGVKALTGLFVTYLEQQKEVATAAQARRIESEIKQLKIIIAEERKKILRLVEARESEGTQRYSASELDAVINAAESEEAPSETTLRIARIIDMIIGSLGTTIGACSMYEIIFLARASALPEFFEINKEKIIVLLSGTGYGIAAGTGDILSYIKEHHAPTEADLAQAQQETAKTALIQQANALLMFSDAAEQHKKFNDSTARVTPGRHYVHAASSSSSEPAHYQASVNALPA